jgi:hypothetical protein
LWLKDGYIPANLQKGEFAECTGQQYSFFVWIEFTGRVKALHGSKSG